MTSGGDVRLVSLLLAALLAQVTMSSHAQAPAPIKLVYATYNSAATAQGKASTWFMKEVTARSGGRVVFETYFSGSLLGAADLYPGAARGAVDIAEGAPTGYNAKDYPLTAVTIPYTTDKFDAVTLAFVELYATSPTLRQEYESKGLKLLYASSFIENTLWTNKKVETRADLKGMRIRALSGIAVAFQELGATVVPMPYPDTPEALKRGAIDGVTASPFDASIIYGLDKIAPFVSDAGGMGVNAMMLTSINQRRFAALPPDIQKILLDVAAETPKQYIHFTDELVQSSAERFASESATQVVRLSAAESKLWRDATTPKLREAWLSTVPDKDKAIELLSNFTGLVHKYEAQSTYVTGIDRYTKIKGQSK
jgi:TRAP-type C4-dicarboxylate transport system substrate-binding protein